MLEVGLERAEGFQTIGQCPFVFFAFELDESYSSLATNRKLAEIDLPSYRGAYASGFDSN